MAYPFQDEEKFVTSRSGQIWVKTNLSFQEQINFYGLFALPIMSYVFSISQESKTSFDYKPYVKSLYSCTVKRLRAADIDQEVKERAIACM